PATGPPSRYGRGWRGGGLPCRAGTHARPAPPVSRRSCGTVLGSGIRFSGTRRFRPQGRDLLGDVDPHGAPHDAPPASDTAGAAELVVPGAQLVGEPLPVPAAGGGPDRAAVDVGEDQVEAGGPVLPPLRMVATEVRDIRHGAAEAGRAG